MNIMKLVNDNKWSTIYNLIKNKKINIYDQLSNTNTIAHLAAINNNSKLMNYFLKNNKDLLEYSNDDGDTPIHLLASYGYTDLLKSCIKSNPSFLNLLNNNDEDVINILYDDLDFIEFASKYNYDIHNDIDEENVITKNIEKCKNKKDKHYKIIKILLKKISKNNTFLLDSIRLNKEYLVDLFINEKNIDQKDDSHLTPFLYAVKNKNHDLMELLIKKGIDINYCGPENDFNPLIYAIEINDEKMIDILLRNNFNVNNFNRFLEIPLHYALQKNGMSKEIVARLLFHSDLNIKNVNGETPLHLLCKNNEWKNYNKIFDKKQLDIFVENNKGKRPIDYLSGNHIYEFIDIIVDGYANNFTNMKEETGLQCNSNSKSDECKKELKKYIFKTKRSIPIKEDQEIVSNKIKIITGDKQIHGLFNSDVIHNVIYTVSILKKYKNIGIPFQHKIPDKVLNDKILFETNDLYKSNDKIISSLINIYRDNFYELSPYLILWKSIDAYYINKNLNIYIKKLMRPEIRFIILKLTIITSQNTSHANILIYDKVTNIFERFEPYGDVPYVDADKLDDVLENLGKTLFKAKYLKPNKIGFQSYSNDNQQSVKKLGDPSGYCLAWTFWYLEMKVNNPSLSQDDLLKMTLKSILDQKNVDRNQLFISFIRNYAANLDKLKNEFMINAGINKNNIYNLVLSNNDYEKVINKLSFEFTLFL